MNDFDNYLKVKSDLPAIAWSGFATAPNPDNLRAYFQKVLNNPDIHIYFMFEEGSEDVIGYAQFVEENADEVHYAGYSVLEKYQGKGYGKLISKLIFEKISELPVKKVFGWISEHNIPSIKSWLANGFVKKEAFKMIRLEALAREDRFDLYEKTL